MSVVDVTGLALTAADILLRSLGEFKRQYDSYKNLAVLLDEAVRAVTRIRLTLTKYGALDSADASRISGAVLKRVETEFSDIETRLNELSQTNKYRVIRVIKARKSYEKLCNVCSQLRDLERHLDLYGLHVYGEETISTKIDNLTKVVRKNTYAVDQHQRVSPPTSRKLGNTRSFSGLFQISDCNAANSCELFQTSDSSKAKKPPRTCYKEKRIRRPPPLAGAQQRPRIIPPPPSVSSFNTADYSELFGTQVSDLAGVPARPKPGRLVPRGSTCESIRPPRLGGGTENGEPDLVVIDGGQVGNGNDGYEFDTDAVYAAFHYYTRIGMRCFAVIPWCTFDINLSLSDKARLRADMLKGRIMVSRPTSRHDIFVRDVSRRFRAYVVSNGQVPADLNSRCIRFRPQLASFRPCNGPGVDSGEE